MAERKEKEDHDTVKFVKFTPCSALDAEPCAPGAR